MVAGCPPPPPPPLLYLSDQLVERIIHHISQPIQYINTIYKYIHMAKISHLYVEREHNETRHRLARVSPPLPPSPASTPTTGKKTSSLSTKLHMRIVKDMPDTLYIRKT